MGCSTVSQTLTSRATSLLGLMKFYPSSCPHHHHFYYFCSCHKFESTVALWSAESATLSLPKAQKTLLFSLSLRPSINYCLWVLENGKHPREINLLQLSQSPNSIAVDGWVECLSLTRLKNRVKSPASAAAILPMPLCASSH